MNVLITGGGCEEKIDNVRSLCNFSTGKTSSVLAEFFAKKGCRVTSIMSYKAIKPIFEKASQNKIVEFKSFLDLQNTLENCLKSEKYDLVIHAAAVSDYSVDFVTIDGKNYNPDQINKINSGCQFSITMKENPKLISSIKKIAKNQNYNPILVGFKLTDHANVDERIKTVQKIIHNENNSSLKVDFVVSNDKSEITNSVHPCAVYNEKLENVFNCNSILELAEFIYNNLACKD